MNTWLPNFLSRLMGDESFGIGNTMFFITAACRSSKNEISLRRCVRHSNEILSAELTRTLSTTVSPAESSPDFKTYLPQKVRRHLFTHLQEFAEIDMEMVEVSLGECLVVGR